MKDLDGNDMGLSDAEMIQENEQTRKMNIELGKENIELREENKAIHEQLAQCVERISELEDEVQFWVQENVDVLKYLKENHYGIWEHLEIGKI